MPVTSIISCSCGARLRMPQTPGKRFRCKLCRTVHRVEELARDIPAAEPLPPRHSAPTPAPRPRSSLRGCLTVFAVVSLLLTIVGGAGGLYLLQAGGDMVGEALAEESSGPTLADRLRAEIETSRPTAAEADNSQPEPAPQSVRTVTAPPEPEPEPFALQAELDSLQFLTADWSSQNIQLYDVDELPAWQRKELLDRCRSELRRVERLLTVFVGAQLDDPNLAADPRFYVDLAQRAVDRRHSALKPAEAFHRERPLAQEVQAAPPELGPQIRYWSGLLEDERYRSLAPILQTRLDELLGPAEARWQELEARLLAPEAVYGLAALEVEVADYLALDLRMHDAEADTLQATLRSRHAVARDAALEPLAERAVDWLRERKRLKCHNCDGEGYTKCGRCGGDGSVRVNVLNGRDTTRSCTSCGGRGTPDCDDCEGGVHGERAVALLADWGSVDGWLRAYKKKLVAIEVDDDLLWATVTARVKLPGTSSYVDESSRWARENGDAPWLRR